MESVQGYGRHLAALVAELPEGCPFVVIARMAGSILAPLDAWAALEAGVRQRQGGTRRQLGSGWVLAEDLEGRGLFVPKARAIYESMGIGFGAFDRLDDAEAWADDLLAGQGGR